MTTVLKALQEIERRAMGGEPLTASSMAHGRRPRWPLVVLVMLPLTGAAVGLILLLQFRSGPDLTPSSAPVAVRGPHVAPEQPARVPPRLTSLRDGDAPRGRVEKKAPAPPAGAERLAPPVPRVAAAAARPRGDSPARGQREPAVPAARPDSEGRAPASSPGDSRVQVKSIAYSPDLAERTVTLRIDGAPAVTLHEGESASGVDVQLILRDAAYIRHGGNIVAVGVSR